MSRQQKTRLLEIDVLRGFAAVFVVMFHYTMGTGHLEKIFNAGFMGVELFFIISGFVIFMTLNKINNAKEFVLGRVARIYPPYWFCVTLYAVVKLYFNQASFNIAFLKVYVANLTMMQTFFHQGSIDAVYWTLLIELTFYLFAVLLYINNLKKFEIVGFAVVALIAFYSMYISSHISTEWNLRVLRYAGLVDFFPLFLSGVIYYKLKFESKNVLRFALLAFCFAVQISMYHVTADRTKWISFNTYFIIILLYNITFLLYSYNLLGFILNKPGIFTGKISYSLYLTHGIISFIVANVMLGLNLHINFWFLLLTKLSCAMLLAYLVHICVEKPSLNYLKNKWLVKKPLPEQLQNAWQ
jgi:peptidoglycan/LPS O-acetylase OafA/YrhL